MKYFVILLILIGFSGTVFATDNQIIHTEHYQPDVELLPDSIIQYGESFSIHAWLPTYDDKPEELQYFVNVLDSENNQIDSTLWFAKEDFVYEFDTTHPAYHIAKSGTYFIKIEKANQLQRTGSFYKTLEFKINFPQDNLTPLKQMQLGIKLAHIICDKDKFAVWNIHLKPACVYPDTESELIKRGWAKLRLMLPAGPDPIKELELTGQNEFSYRVMGNLVYGDEKYPLSDDRKREIAWEYSQQYHPKESYLEYAITSHEKYHDVGDKIQFDLLEWGNYQNCWNLKLQILDIYDESVYEDNPVKYCLEPDGVLGTFHSYSMGNEFDEFVCKNTGYYRIEVSNGMVHPPKILENFVCMEPENEN